MVIDSTPTVDYEVKVCIGSFVKLHLINISDKYEGRYKLVFWHLKLYALYFHE